MVQFSNSVRNTEVIALPNKKRDRSNLVSARSVSADASRECEGFTFN